MGLFQSTGIEGYLRDESGLTGEASAIAFPSTLEEAQNVLQSAHSQNLPVAFQGARTGICGGAVPRGGLIVNFSRMNKALDFRYDPAAGTGSISVEAGFTLEQLQVSLDKKQIDTGLFNETALANWARYRQETEKLWFLPNPSEKTATLGGVVCTAAGGGHTGIHVAAEIEGITLILPDGCRLHVQHEDKNINGIPVSDALEVICGSEGLYGAVIELTLVLRKKPGEQYGLLGYFSGYSQIPLFMETLEAKLKTISEVKILSACFFSSACAAFAAQAGKTLAELGRYPPFPPNTAAALWLELGGSEESLFSALETVLLSLEQADAMADQALAADGERDFERLGRLRHLLTEAANLADSGRPPLLADITVPKSDWLKTIRFIDSSLAQTDLIYTLMGHLQWNSFSLRFPGVQPSAEDVLANLLKETALGQCRCEGDHGIGRIKKSQFRALSPGKSAAILEIKRSLDPDGRMNPGVLVDGIKTPLHNNEVYH